MDIILNNNNINIELAEYINRKIRVKKVVKIL